VGERREARTNGFGEEVEVAGGREGGRRSALAMRVYIKEEGLHVVELEQICSSHWAKDGHLEGSV